MKFTPTIMEQRAKDIVPYPPKDLPSTAQPLSSSKASRSIAERNPHPPLDSPPPRRTQIFGTNLSLERPPVSTYDDNPVFDERGAAAYLGLSQECLKKWRQRNQGPDYIQYGPGGTVRYELSALMAFRATHRVKVGAKR
jgi:hypothetical protein